MNCNFQVGQKVMLFRSFGPMSMSRADVDGVMLPVKGTVYTVREYDPDAGTEEPHIRLVEITNLPVSDGFEPSFEASLFRPVVQRGTETGMSILRELLNKTGKPVEVVA